MRAARLRKRAAPPNSAAQCHDPCPPHIAGGPQKANPKVPGKCIRRWERPDAPSPFLRKTCMHPRVFPGYFPPLFSLVTRRFSPKLLSVFSSCDILIVGAGPAGLSCAIRLLQRDSSLRVWVLEKSAVPGAHLLSGAVLDPAPLRDLLSPEDYASLPLFPPVARQRFAYLTQRRALPLPFAPPPMSMRGQPLADAALLGRSLAAIATRLGAEIACSQPAVALDLSPCPDAPPVVLTGDPRTPEPVAASRAVVLAEGPAGTLATAAAKQFPALAPPTPQSYSLGIKRTYTLPPDAISSFPLSSVLHTFGHPLPSTTFGGGFLYRPTPTRLDVGFVTAIENGVSPRAAFLSFLSHPSIAPLLSNATPVSYGARLLPETGWHAIPETLSLGTSLYLAGDDAGLLDALTLKGIHLAVESGIAAADAILSGRPLLRSSLPSASALRRHRAYRPAFSRGLLPGIATAALLTLTRGLLPPSGDAASCRVSSLTPPPPSPPQNSKRETQTSPDPSLPLDLALSRLTPAPPSLPPHIALRDPALCLSCPTPCLSFCPASVYESRSPLRASASPSESSPPLLHPENCLHCRTCLVACPRSNILWTPPPSGPSYLPPS